MDPSSWLLLTELSAWYIRLKENFIQAFGCWGGRRCSEEIRGLPAGFTEAQPLMEIHRGYLLAAVPTWTRSWPSIVDRAPKAVQAPAGTRCSLRREAWFKLNSTGKDGFRIRLKSRNNVTSVNKNVLDAAGWVLPTWRVFGKVIQNIYLWARIAGVINIYFYWWWKWFFLPAQREWVTAAVFSHFIYIYTCMCVTARLLSRIPEVRKLPLQVTSSGHSLRSA